MEVFNFISCQSRPVKSSGQWGSADLHYYTIHHNKVQSHHFSS